MEQTENVHLFGNVDFNTSLLHILTQHDVKLHVYNHYGYYDGTYYPRNSRISGYTTVHFACGACGSGNGSTYDLFYMHVVGFKVECTDFVWKQPDGFICM
ncbi:CRISPR-associated endonuclease Cas1 [Paenibacillus campi]|uniref:CRISPR-associated endonuclease Cas1 n=1 Tax=Paenibacillus campi TaxID=3106031 RepID=UPI003A4C615D